MESSLVKIDKDIPLEDAALVSCAVMTGAGAIFNAAKLEPGDRVAIVGLGGVGMSALLAAVSVGASLIAAIDTNPAKLQTAKAMGATHVFNATDTDCVEQVRTAFNGGCDVAVETAGSDAAMRTAYAITARGGTTVAVGLPHPGVQFAFPQGAHVAEEKRVIGSFMGSGMPMRDIPRILEMYKAGKLPFDKLKSNTLCFEDLNTGFDQLSDGTVLRNILLPR